MPVLAPPHVPRSEIALRCAEIVPRLVSLVDLESDKCRYPYGEGPYLFCGHPKREGDGINYCAEHQDLAHRDGRFACHEMPPQTLAGLRRARGSGRRVLGRIGAMEDATL